MSAAGEPAFIVYDDERPIKYKEGRLVRAIKAGELEGDELFRRADEADNALRPLHQSLLFQQVHGVDAPGAARLVDVHKVRSFSRHLTSFVTVILGLTVVGVNTSWAPFWAIGLAIHFGKIAPSFARLHREREDGGIQSILGVLYGTGERSLPEPEVTQEEAASDESDSTLSPQNFARVPRIKDALPEPALHGELREELGRLDPLRDALDEPGNKALDDTRRVLDELFERRRHIAVHLHGEDEEHLAQEVAELETELTDPSLDAQTREALQQTQQAVQQRQESLADARRADVRLRARARAALHQLKSLRLSLVSSTGAADHETAAPLGAVVNALREEMAGAEELEEALAEARDLPRAARARRTQ
ncbi:MAG: 2TM domain-containing protein [Deltaproteobacteria bacterium]|nr:2TM domain-containing protein [Deltaproteobacteria bacterium]